MKKKCEMANSKRKRNHNFAVGCGDTQHLENEGSYKYIDFEYSGKDDIAKLCLDFVQQPNHANKHRDAEKWLLEKMTKFDPESSGDWIERYHTSKNINAIKWACIIIKNSSREMRIKKAVNYLRAHLQE